jgi:cysteine desulfurase / selenocysteine lyase
LLTVQHVDDALDTEGAKTRDLPCRPTSHLADHDSGARHRVSPQQRDGPLASSGATKAMKRPSLATWSGSRPRSSQAVTGGVSPVKEIAEMTHERGGLLILDAAQTAGDLDIDMQDLGVDVLAAPGHKGLYGPMGTGVLVLSAPLPVKPFREGGTGFKSESPEQPEEYPWRLEAGTLNLPGIAGLAAGVRFVRSVGVNAVAEHGANLARALADGLRQIDGASVFCDPAPRTGVVSFRLDAGDVALTGTILDESFGIAVRTGLHCAPAAHRAIGTFPEGTVRVSFGQFNTRGHVDALVAEVRQIRTIHAADRSVRA